MVVGAFPIAKLSVLLIKQISKPIANVCKERAKSHPFFRTYVCMPPAQFYNWCEVKAKMWILNLGKPVNIPVLSQDMAIELGANLLGEGVIFLIGASLLLFEYNRQTNKETAKEAKREEEMKHIANTIADLYFTVQQQQTQMREMERLVHSLSGVKVKSPPEQPPHQGVDDSKSPPTTSPPKSNSPQSSHPVTNSVIECSPEETNENTKDNNSPQQISTPYPDRGLILQSLNYIQMDVFSSMFPNNRNMEVTEEQKSNQKHEPAILSKALHNIENEFKSLF